MIDSRPLIYNGYFMRSRLEARWARFFELIGVEYVYEYKYFNTPYGQYLPDFYLPAFGLWIEIKPKAPSNEEIGKCMSVGEATGEACLIIGGVPYNCFTYPVRQTYSEAGFWFFNERTNIAGVNASNILHGMDNEAQLRIKSALTESFTATIKEQLLRFSDYVMFTENEVFMQNTYEHNHNLSAVRMSSRKG